MKYKRGEKTGSRLQRDECVKVFFLYYHVFVIFMKGDNTRVKCHREIPTCCDLISN